MCVKIYKLKIDNNGKVTKKLSPQKLFDTNFRDISEITIIRIPKENTIYLYKETLLFSPKTKKIRQAERDNKGKYMGL